MENTDITLNVPKAKKPLSEAQKKAHKNIFEKLKIMKNTKNINDKMQRDIMKKISSML